MGVVYKARDTKLGRFVALKLLPPGAGERRESRERFLNEARTASSLGHPNIVTIHDILEHDGTDVLVMEFIPGHTLEQILGAGGPVKVSDAIDYAGQIADALAAAHRIGLIHRDLKPGNIMITPEGRVKVVDFGLAKLASGSDSSEDQAATRKALTAKGAIIGTVAYMSPEQAEGKPLDSRSDIFSYGAVVYEMLTGRRAFTGDSGASTMAAVLREEPLPLPQTLPAIPQSLDLLVTACLRKDPNKRLQSLGDVRLLLQVAVPAIASAKQEAPRRPIALLARTAVAVAIASMGVAYLLWGRSTPVPEARPIRLARLTSGRPAFSPALSPDGNLVAYTRQAGERANSGAFTPRATDLFLQPVRGGAEVRLTNLGSLVLFPQFSADRSRVYFTSLAKPYGVYEVSITGGEPRLVVRDAYRLVPSPDGKWLAYNVDGRLLLRSIEGGPEKLLARNVGLGFRWSPDSTQLLGGRGFGDSRFDISRFPISGAPPVDTGLLPNLRTRNLVVSNITELIAWLPGDEILFCSTMGSAANLYRLPLSRLADGAPIPVTNGVGNNCAASIARDRIVFANQQLTNSIFRLPADLDQGKVTGALERVTGEGVDSQFPDVRPDGSAMAFIERGENGHGVYFMDLRRRVTRSVVVGQANNAYTTFSPDGAKIAYGRGGDTWPAFVVPTTGGEPEPVGGAYGRIRGWSPDGRFLLTWRQPARSLVGVLDLSTQKAAEIIKSDKLLAIAPRFSPDGKWVVFSAAGQLADTPDLYVAPFRGSQPVPESEWRMLTPNGVNPVWSRDGRSLYFLRTSEGLSRLMRVAMEDQNRFKGEPAEFYRFEGRNLSGLLLNTMTASREHLYMVLLDGPSDIWTMDLPFATPTR